MVPFSLRLQLKFVNDSTQPFPQIGAYPIFSQLASQLQKGISLGKELQTSKQSFFLQMTKEFLDKSQEKNHLGWPLSKLVPLFVSKTIAL